MRALTRGGRRVAVPFVANDLGVLGNAPRRGPSYLGQQRVTAGELPGPSAAVTTPPAGKIGWVTRRESRGRRFVNRGLAPLFGKVVFARTVQPDPESPFRLGIALTSGPPRAVVSAARTGRRTWLRPNRLTLCFTELVPLRGRRTGDIYCTQGSEEALLPPGWPLLIGDVQNDQVTRVSGIAADGVAAIDLFLASGRVVPAAMRDNAYTVEAPTTQFPAKLVAYDAKHRPVWVWVPQALAPAKVIPCPPAAVPGAVSAPAPEPYERLDLATGEINGHAIFGRSPRKVEAALGRPDFVQSGHDLGQRFTAFFFGGRRRQPIGGQFGWTDAALVVGFGWRQHRLRANSLSYEGPALVDAQLGHVLRLQPAELQRKIAAAYGSTYRLVVAYGSEPGGLGCGASFEARKGRLELSFGLRPWLSRRPFLILRRPS
jgi:hypothetical protein